jgi:hypothetical protein
MCEPQTLDTIREVVTEYVDSDRMFTVFDISLEVKQRARAKGDVVERHRHMKNTIHMEVDQYLQNSLYERQLLDVGAPSKAFVYYPEGKDPATYEPKKRLDAPQATAQAPGAVSPAPPVAPPLPQSAPTGTQTLDDDEDEDEGDAKDSGHKADGRGTLAVPCYLVRAAKFNPQEKAYIYAEDRNGDKVVVVSKQKPGVSPVTAYTVDKYHNVRITKGQLVAGGVGASTYDFELDGDDVIVKAHQT